MALYFSLRSTLVVVPTTAPRGARYHSRPKPKNLPIFSVPPPTPSRLKKEGKVFWFWFGVATLYFITPLCQVTTFSILNISMTDSSKKLASNMKKIRARKQMSQGDICRELGVDRAYISTIESGRQNPTLSTIEKIAKALGVSVDELLK